VTPTGFEPVLPP